MIFLAFLLPLSIYLFILGSINRRHHPIMVSGVTDFIGILFAVSGFLIFGGPGILSALNARMRQFWLLGNLPGIGSEGFWQFWVFLSIFYFLIVVTGVVLVFRTSRALTAIYNAEPEAVQRCLMQVCERLGLDPIRSGNLFVFGADTASKDESANPEGIQTDAASTTARLRKALPHEPTVLEVEPFTRMHNVTLRWEPANSVLRRAVEAELKRALAATPAQPTELGIWLTMIGVTLFGLTVIAGGTLMAVRMFL